jgi:hypothetical protein
VQASECEAEDDTGGVPGRDKAGTGEVAIGSARASKAEEDNASGTPGANEAVKDDDIDGAPGEGRSASWWIGSVVS